MNGAPWTPAELEWLETEFRPTLGEKARRKIEKEFEKVSGNKRSFNSLYIKANRTGTSSKFFCDLPIMTEFAKEIGASPGTMHAYLKRHPELKIKKIGQYKYLPKATQEALRAWFQRPQGVEKVAIPSAEAARILGVHINRISSYVKWGVLKGRLIQNTLWVDARSVDDARLLKARHGRIWMSKIEDRLTPEYFEARRKDLARRATKIGA